MSENKVVALHGHVTPAEASEEIIEVLEDALTAARAGELTNCALVCIRKNYSYYSAWAGGDFLQVLGAVAHLQHDMLRKRDEGIV